MLFLVMGKLGNAAAQGERDESQKLLSYVFPVKLMDDDITAGQFVAWCHILLAFDTFVTSDMTKVRRRQLWQHIMTGAPAAGGRTLA